MVAGLAAAAFLFRGALLTGVAELVVVEDRLTPADLIFVLNGDVHTRPFRAAQLYREGLAPRVVIAREQARPATRLGLYPGDADVAVEIMRREGVPGSAILVLETEGGVTSTSDEAEALRRHVAATSARRVIVVTSDYHTARARWLVRRAPGMDSTQVLMAGAPDDRFSPANWWRSEAGLVAYVQEYLKFAHNAIFR